MGFAVSIQNFVHKQEIEIKLIVTPLFNDIANKNKIKNSSYTYFSIYVQYYNKFARFNIKSCI